jgi:hypothetical protein
VYELERKHVKPSNRSKSTDILLFVAWKSESYKKFCVLVQLMECNGWFYCREIDLKEHYQKDASQLRIYTGPIKDTWLIPDGTVLMTELELDFTRRDGALNITISEGTRNDHAKRLIRIDLKK